MNHFPKPGESYEMLQQMVKAAVKADTPEHAADLYKQTYDWYASGMKTTLNPDERAAIDTLFTYHAPTPDQIDSLQLVREQAKQLADVIVMCCPRSADRTAALRKLRECTMTANASIVLPPIPPGAI